MSKKQCLSEIRRKYTLLTAVEKNIADYILKNPDKVINMSVRELAENTKTVNSAVIRLCKSVGFEGFPDMKISLAVELSKNEEVNFSPYVSEEDQEDAVVTKIFSANIKSLRDTMENIDKKAFKRVVSLIDSSKKIFIYGVGTSAFLATELHYRMMFLGYNAFVFTDVIKMKTSTVLIEKGDLVIGISHTGMTTFVCDSVASAKEIGANTVCITSFENSPLWDICDERLVICSDEINYPIEALSARIAQLSLVEALTAAISVKNYDMANVIAKKNHQIVNSMRYKPKKKVL